MQSLLMAINHAYFPLASPVFSYHLFRFDLLGRVNSSEFFFLKKLKKSKRGICKGISSNGEGKSKGAMNAFLIQRVKGEKLLP